MRFRNALTLSCTAGILAIASVLPASAGTFAQFIQQVGNNAFSLTAPSSLGPPPTGQVLSATGLPVFFQFKNSPDGPIASAPLNTDILATLTFTTTSVSGAIPVGANQAIEQFSPVSFSFIATGQTIGSFVIPAGTNLLTGTTTFFSPPPPPPVVNGFNSLSGTLGGSSATFSGSDVNINQAGNPTAPIAQRVNYSSAYIDFTTAFNKAFAYSFSSVQPIYSVSGPPPGGFINPFTASGSGTFSAVQAVPEPSAVAMLAGLGVTGSLFAFRRLRRRR
jgi:hypothetical protein